MKGPVILVANLLTEGRGMAGFTAADAVARIEEAIGRPVDMVIANMTLADREGARPLRARTQGAARARHAAVALRAGRRRVLDSATSPGTIGSGWPMRCGACCRSGCSVRTSAARQACGDRPVAVGQRAHASLVWPRLFSPVRRPCSVFSPAPSPPSASRACARPLTPGGRSFSWRPAFRGRWPWRAVWRWQRSWCRSVRCRRNPLSAWPRAR